MTADQKGQPEVSRLAHETPTAADETNVVRLRVRETSDKDRLVELYLGLTDAIALLENELPAGELAAAAIAAIVVDDLASTTAPSGYGPTVAAAAAVRLVLDAARPLLGNVSELERARLAVRVLAPDA